MQAVLDHIERNDLSGGEMDEMLKGVAPVKLYSTLANASLDWFGPTGAVALLFPVQSEKSGHWLGIWKDDSTRTVHHFDSYGMPPATEDQYSTQPDVEQRLLQLFYRRCMEAGYRVAYNQTRYQVLGGGMNTCGRHVICRLRLRYLDDNKYAHLMSHNSMSPDDIVTLMTFLALNEDKADKAQLTSLL
jgi:hypothetical protein